MAKETRKIPIAMKKGMLMLKETDQIPLKDNMVLQTGDYEFYCNTSTFNKVAGYMSSEDDEAANKLLTTFFMKTATAVNINHLCFNRDIKFQLDKN